MAGNSTMEEEILTPTDDYLNFPSTEGTADPILHNTDAVSPAVPTTSGRPILIHGATSPQRPSESLPQPHPFSESAPPSIRLHHAEDLPPPTPPTDPLQVHKRTPVSDHVPLPTIGHLLHRGRSSPHETPSPSHRASDRSNRNITADPTPRSTSQHRSSPVVLIKQLAGELFVPIDPFRIRWHIRLPCFPSSQDPQPTAPADAAAATEPLYPSCEHACACCLPFPVTQPQMPRPRLIAIKPFIIDTIPRVLYLYFHLRLPSLYFTRVARIFLDAEISKPELDSMVKKYSQGIDTGQGGIGALGSPPHFPGVLPYPDESTPTTISANLARFRRNWEVFISSLLKEWKTFNVVSALLLTAIITMIQIPSVLNDPLTRTASFLSLICALYSLSYGCIYIVRFANMRSMYKAARWAEEAGNDKTLIWWNPWVLLAMPAVWLAWSMILFIVGILSFVWRTGSTADPPERDKPRPRQALGPRIAITCVFALGLIYFILIVRTLRRYSGRTKHYGGRDASMHIEEGHGAPAANADAAVAGAENKTAPEESESALGLYSVRTPEVSALGANKEGSSKGGTEMVEKKEEQIS